MPKKVVLTYIVNEGESVVENLPVARGFIDVPDPRVAPPSNLQIMFDEVCKSNKFLRSRVEALEFELQQLTELHRKKSEELATVNRERVHAQDKLRKIDDIISPF